MRNTASRALIILAVLCTAAAQSQQKLAQTGMKFLNVGTDARAVSLGEAVTSVEFNSAAMFYNPASMARLPHAADIRFCNTRFIADIQHYAGNIALAPAHGDYGVLGFFVHYVDYGLFQGTVRADNEQGYLETGAFSPSAFTVGASYARALNDKFSVGGSAKFVRQELGPSANAVGPGGFPVLSENSAEVMAFDFGILYRTGFKSLNFGMVVRNFSKEVKYEKEGFQLPLTFKIGLSMNLVDLMSLENPDHALLLSFDAEHPRDFAETVRFGVEYGLMDFLALRVGYVSPQSEYKMSYGIGLRRKSDGQSMGLGFDYAYTDFGIFGGIHRFTLHVSLL